MLFKSSRIVLGIYLLIRYACAFIHPIEVNGKQFVDSVTGEPFFIKGIDYQPGGSSSVNDNQDPLSDPGKCARDIILFQELGINTIRIYSINPDLDHNVCMTMLAAAGIYLILDVNSPLENQHLNRYEPWTTYNELYLRHVFKVIEQFSNYNNTLGFFAGNEVVNDSRSAKYSPPYLKALVSDMKKYIHENAPRAIPVGYSAVDDLHFRVSLSKYLECHDPSNPYNEVDFYGVNSYQWCGKQTFVSSGYDKLVNAYRDYSKPVFFSEYGCNEVLPRQFEEVQALYSSDMYTVFSGGLVYEFNQEANNYGLIDTDADGNAILLPDFRTLQSVFKKVRFPSTLEVRQAILKDNVVAMAPAVKSKCESSYQNLDISHPVAANLATNMIKSSVKVRESKYVDLTLEQLKTPYKIFESNGKEVLRNARVDIVSNFDGEDLKNIRRLHKHRYRSEASSYSKFSTLVLITIGIIELAFQLSVI
ncbi:HBL298Wp [Eremothecium sinecaudum]|uniref:1,3-beta-glucanosyltransferase n=1 Tax=Eremothecium sinecaudum TaxID=45286 RepID=A0A120K0R2_9SACH|nr:HBL298Wp [Eremothecium sinecaudum]AMD18604.1 HBL298Wp [Eremothecium sinecaudum]